VWNIVITYNIDIYIYIQLIPLSTVTIQIQINLSHSKYFSTVIDRTRISCRIFLLFFNAIDVKNVKCVIHTPIYSFTLFVQLKCIPIFLKTF